MVLMPEFKETTLSKLESIKVVAENRSYLSMSDIGNDCMRAMWMSFRWCSKRELTSKQVRIFNRGNIEEKRVISYLKSIGIEVFKVIDNQEIEMTGDEEEKQEELIGFAGHSKGHPDGRVRGVIEAPKTVHLLEIKTKKDDLFKKLLKEKLKTSDPGYYDQMQRYMGQMELTRGLFICVNKNDEEIYIERVYFDKQRYQELLDKERSVILSEYIPDAPYKPTWYKCRWCNHKYTCHYEYYDRVGEGKLPKRNCRTCKFADLGDDGKWFCSAQNDKELSLQEQKDGCNMYKLGIYEDK